MTALGIETSCDDCSVSAVSEDGGILFLASQSQNSLHNKYGGILPEAASRQHGIWLLPLIEEALKTAPLESIDVIAAASRPGLLGSLLAGLTTAKTLSMAWGRPFVGVNHIEAHVFSPFLWRPPEGRKPEPRFPALALVASGGHSALFSARGPGQSDLLCSTRDDAAGEALDKFGKMLGLPWPGGPEVDRLAAQAPPGAPRGFFPKIKAGGLFFSFSGLKSAAQRLLDGKSREWTEENKAALCADFQESVVSHIMEKTQMAFERSPARQILAGGGVTANSLLRRRLKAWAKSQSLELLLPEKACCGDNAAMIAWTGLKYFLKGETSPLDLCASPRHLKKDFFCSS